MAAAPARAAAAPARSPAPRRVRPKRHQASRSRAAGSRGGPRRANRALASRMQPAAAGAAIIPHAAVRTAGAVRDISESSLIHRLTRGRMWIGVLCALLAGIVALNVLSLGLNATSGRTAEAISELEQKNSALKAELAEKLSANRVEAQAAALGLIVPAPGEITYLRADGGDARRADNLLSDGTSTYAPGSYSTPAYSAPTYAAPTTSPPATTAPTAPTAPAPAPAPTSGGSTGGGGGILPG